MKLSREIRLAYLVTLLYRRLLTGHNTKTAWLRHFKLTAELDREKLSNELAGMWVNNKFILAPQHKRKTYE